MPSAAKFRQFLDSRYMGECLRLYAELESFEFERREAARYVAWLCVAVSGVGD